VLILAPAKINLTLRVLSKRADGYHEISSEMRAIRLFDEVIIALHESEGGEWGAVHLSCTGLPDGPDNLAYRAAELFLATYARGVSAPAAINITLKKSIPVAAGLAGGSADAAAVLVGLARELANEATLADLAAIGASLGADVPFCVYACAAANPTLGYKGAASALAEGIGERLTPIEDAEQAWVILVKPDVALSTKEIYELYDVGGEDSRDCPYCLTDNDLEAHCVTALPVVGDIISGLKQICAEEGAQSAKVQLSGSGPTVFAYLPAKDTGERTAERIYGLVKESFPGMFTCLTKTI
jgi:4-diphosphocytidyl-2-C-methyl-D-erythritol kinase